MSEVLDTDSISLDDLYKLADEVVQAEAERPRDEHGRFLPTTAVEEDKVYRKEIDLGDGSGPQVFTGESYDDLIDKIAAAQVLQAKTINDQKVRLKALETPAVVRELTADELQAERDAEYVLAQELVTYPTKTIERMVEKQIARRIEAEQKRVEREQAVGIDFVAHHPDYFPSPGNQKKFEKYFQAYKIDYSVANLEAAYTDLKDLLEVKPAAKEEDTVADTTQEVVEVQRQVAEPVQRTKVASGLSTARTTGPTEDELDKLSTDRLKELAQRQLFSQRA
jgi:hypothetical protein